MNIRGGLNWRNVLWMPGFLSREIRSVHPLTPPPHPLAQPLPGLLADGEREGGREGRVDVLYVVICACVAYFLFYWCLCNDTLFAFVCVCVYRQIEDGLFCWNPPPTAQASVDHFNLPPHVSEGTAFPETWHTVQGGVTSSDRIDNLPF